MRPSASWRITTRLASHARRRDGIDSVVERGLGDECECVRLLLLDRRRFRGTVLVSRFCWTVYVLRSRGTVHQLRSRRTVAGGFRTCPLMQRLSRRRECLNLLKRITLLPERVPSYDEFPYDIPFVRDLGLAFGKAVTCFVGDNGRASRRSSRRSPRRARCRSGAAAATRRPIPTGRISAPRSAAHCALHSVGVRATAISSAPTRTSRAIPTRATAADR